MARKKKKIDFTDQDAVLDEVAKAMDVDPDQLSIDTSSMEGFGVDVYEISVDGGSNTWGVVESDDAFRELALAIVKQDLEEDPSMFNKDFIKRHINIDRLRRDLESDVQNMAEEDLREMSDRDFWRTAKDYIDVPDEDDDGDMPDPEDYIDDVAEQMTKEKLRDPMEYLEEIYSSSEAVEKAIEIAGIDVNAAAEDAVDTDGPEHFVARYDGNYDTTPSGFVYWRDN